MSGHTPGPWFRMGRSIGIEGGELATTWDRDGRAIANARLMAASPELLKVAQAYMDAFERHCITNTHGARDFDFSGDIARLASAAIAKATGQ